MTAKITRRFESHAVRLGACICFPLDCLGALLANPGLRWYARQKQKQGNPAKGLSAAKVRVQGGHAQVIAGLFLLPVALIGLAFVWPGKCLQRYIDRRIAEKSHQLEEALRKATFRNPKRYGAEAAE